MNPIAFDSNSLPEETKIAKNAKQLYGKEVGELKILYPYRRNNDNKIMWLCKCSCGTYCGVSSVCLTRKNPTSSCGCLRKTIIRKKYGKISPNQQIASLKVIKLLEDSKWEVQCLWCEKIYTVTNRYLLYLLNNEIKECSCGCKKNELITKNKIINLKNKTFGFLKVLNNTQDIIDHNAVWECECICGKRIKVLSRDLLHKRKISCGCKNLNTSKDAFKIFELLTELDYDFLTEYSFKDLVSENSVPLRFDFAVMFNQKVCLLIEVQGRQHYMPVDVFGGQKQFEIQQFNDNKKREYCKNRNIPLLELSYKEINSLTIDDLKERIENLWQKR